MRQLRGEVPPARQVPDLEHVAVVTEAGCELITRGVPVAPDEIEALMRA